jgi:hypothetical protein
MNKNAYYATVLLFVFLGFIFLWGNSTPKQSTDLVGGKVVEKIPDKVMNGDKVEIATGGSRTIVNVVKMTTLPGDITSEGLSQIPASSNSGFNRPIVIVRKPSQAWVDNPHSAVAVSSDRSRLDGFKLISVDDSSIEILLPTSKIQTVKPGEAIDSKIILVKIDRAKGLLVLKIDGKLFDRSFISMGLSE